MVLPVSKSAFTFTPNTLTAMNKPLSLGVRVGELGLVQVGLFKTEA